METRLDYIIRYADALCYGKPDRVKEAIENNDNAILELERINLRNNQEIENFLKWVL